MAVNAKLGVDLSSFEAGIRSGQAILKGLNAEMKATEAEFKATGNAEKALEQKTKTLNSQLRVQKGIVDQAQKALKAMDDAGVKPTDAAYQKLYATMMNATAGMNETQAALNSLTASEQTAAAGANNLTNSVNGIGKKISLDQVISGINGITSGLENAAQKAVSLGESIWNSVMDSAAWSDDVATMADRMGLTTEQVQKMRVVADQFEAPVESIAKTWKKVKMNMASDSEEVVNTFKSIGVATKELAGDEGVGQFKSRDYQDVFWEIGEALMNMDDASRQEQVAMKLLGKSWDEMIPLFKRGRKEYEAALASVDTADDETIKNNAALKDSVSALEEQFSIFKADVLGNISPQLTKVTDTFSGLLNAITEYINTPDGQELLSGIGESIGSLIEDISKINPEEVVSGFVSVVNTLVDGLKWIVDNKDSLVTALEVVVAGWAGLKLTGSVLTIVKLIDGLKGLGLLGGGKAAAAAASGTASGGNWLSGVMPGIGSQLPALASWTSVNGGPVIDWLTHESPIAGVLSGRESIGDLWSRFTGNVQNNINTFGEDWENNNLLKPFISAGENMIRFWDQFWKGSGPIYTPGTDEEANWLPSYMKDITPPEITVDPVPPDNAAAEIEEEVGTVVIPAELDWRPSYMRGYANGLAYVHSDGLYRLHKGERVTPAREVQSRNFSSNLYVENMNMSGGLSADALASAIASRNSRIMAGYGS